MRQEVAKTSRTVVRKLALDDAAFLHQLMRSEGFLKYIGDRDIKSIADAENYLRDKFFKVYEASGYGYYLIENEHGERVGIAGFLNKPHLENEDYGFAIIPAQMGKGYAYEASVAILLFAQKEFGFKALDAETLPNNLASIGLLEKLGFQKIKTLPATVEHEELLLFRLAFE